MGQRFPGVGLLQTTLDLREEVQTLHRIFDRSIGGQGFDRLQDSLLDRLLGQRNLQTSVGTCRESTARLAIDQGAYDFSACRSKERGGVATAAVSARGGEEYASGSVGDQRSGFRSGFRIYKGGRASGPGRSDQTKATDRVAAATTKQRSLFDSASAGTMKKPGRPGW